MITPNRQHPSGDFVPVPVWDLPTRLFHWTLVGLVGVLWYTGENGPLDWHMAAGTWVLVLVVFRLAWGVVGGRHSRFADFVAPPGEALRYLRRVLAPGPAPRHIGHNPAGGWMVLALLAALTAQAVTGLFADDEIFTTGPLNHLVSASTAQRLTSLHHLGFNLLLGLVAVHVTAVLGYLFFKKDNLIRPMITGSKPLPPSAEKPARANPWLALAVAAAAAALVWGLLAWLGR